MAIILSSGGWVKSSLMMAINTHTARHFIQAYSEDMVRRDL